MRDSQYQTLPRPSQGMVHGYGPRLHLLSYPFAMSMLNRLSAPGTVQPEVNRLLSTMYDLLLGEVANTILQTKQVESETRMIAATEHGIYRGEQIDPDQRVVVVDVVRAGIIPAHRFYDGLHHVIHPHNLRQDHVVASRLTDAQDRVIGVTLDGSKIGGPIDDATVIFPDPMGATGSSIAGVISHYHSTLGGKARAMAAVHLIVTPEYIKRMQTEFPDLHIFAIRLDRGLSDEQTLGTIPGSHHDQECGLTKNQYIVPGAGGVGEVLNNAWI